MGRFDENVCLVFVVFVVNFNVIVVVIIIIIIIIIKVCLSLEKEYMIWTSSKEGWQKQTQQKITQTNIATSILDTGEPSGPHTSAL